MHCTAFRRLVYKTQVFVNHEGDLFRTRLTHSLEVAQLGRSIARALALNEDLVEAIALAHDLGHTPFGHAGQDALDDCMKPHGGFEHNLQSLRVVDVLEQRYPRFDGLNLTLETREGILKRCSSARGAAHGGRRARRPGAAHRRRRAAEPRSAARQPGRRDGLQRARHRRRPALGPARAWRSWTRCRCLPRTARAALAEHPHLQDTPERRLLAETLRRLLSAQVADVIAATTANAAQRTRRRTRSDVHALPPLVQFTPAMREQVTALKRFLFASLYRHPQVAQTTSQAREVVRALFAAYADAPQQLPDEHRAALRADRPARAWPTTSPA